MSVTRLICPHVCGLPIAYCACVDDLYPTHTPSALRRLAERQFVRINDPRGVPAYHPTEYQPIRVGGPET